ncbi:hypothetical protein C6W19_21685 [Bacillus sp. RJGP41]|nr:hypothetical protein C6W19_21685 [Bacillus sp. RJGP41]
MNSNAPGQLLGYSLQFPRALYHLLKCSPDESVCIEVLGDVAILNAEGGVITEEDKSSINGNPITDKSTDLWKTLSNWIKANISGDLNILNSKFILYSNQSGRKGIASKFSSAQNRVEAQAAIDYAKNKLKGIKSDHDIWEYYDFVINKNEKLLIKLVERFEVQIGNGTGYDEVHKELLRQHVPKSQIGFISNNLSGWLFQEVIEKIVAREHAIISWKEFDKQFIVQFDRARRRELIDFTLQESYGKEIIKTQIKTRPLYLIQLEEIGLPEDEIIEAVVDYMRADTNREKWIESEIIDIGVAEEFEDKLKSFWKNKSKLILLTKKGELNEKELGQMLLLECKLRQVTIRDMDPPDSTVAGTYHALADELALGWHPNWEEIFVKKGG